MRLAFVLAVLAGVIVWMLRRRRRVSAVATRGTRMQAPEVRNVKIVYLAADLALSTRQLEALARSAGEPNAVDHTLPPTDDGERLHIVELTWPDDRLRGSEPATRLWLYQVPANPLHLLTRSQILKGASFVIICADGRLPVHESVRWIEELHAAHGDLLATIIVQYVCPPGSTVDAATLARALDPKGELVGLVFDHDDPAELAARTMQAIVDAIVERR